MQRQPFGGWVGALVLIGAMCGAMGTIATPGLGFVWTPLGSARAEPAKNGSDLWILTPRRRPRGESIFCLAGRQWIMQWCVLCLGLTLAYCPVVFIAFISAFVGKAASPARLPTQRWMFAIAGIMAIISIRTATVIFQNWAANGRKVVSRIASAQRVMLAVAIGGASIAVSAAMISGIPAKLGIVAVLVSVAASEAGFFSALFANRSGLRWPGEPPL